MFSSNHVNETSWPDFADSAMDLLNPIRRFFKAAHQHHQPQSTKSFSVGEGSNTRYLACEVRRSDLTIQTDSADTNRVDLRFFIGYGVYGTVQTAAAVAGLKAELQEMVEGSISHRQIRNAEGSFKAVFSDGSMTLKAEGNTQGWIIQVCLMIRASAMTRGLAVSHSAQN